jgi:glucan-binding YG repeat protein
MLASIALLVVSAASLVSAKGWVQVGGNWYYQNADGDYVTETIQSSGTAKFYLGEDGAMVTDYFLESYGNGDNAYYFGSNGAMVTNTWVAIDPSVVSDQGDYVPDAYWYYFQATGKAVKAGDNNLKKVTIDGKKYAFNQSGQMLTGWIDADSGSIISPEDEEHPYKNATYYGGGDNDGVLHSGWLTYYDSGDDWAEDRDFMYFYFNPTNNKKIGNANDNENVGHVSSVANGGIEYTTKKINGRTYAFSIPYGIMLIEWEGYNGSTESIASHNNAWYFSAQDDGHRAQKGWVLAVPAEDIDEKDYKDDEEDWFYFSNNGDIVKDQIKKINGKYYAFNESGEMKKGLIVFSDGHYKKKFDMDNTRGAELAKAGVWRNGDNEQKTLAWDDAQMITWEGRPAAIHYFGSDGARKTGANNIEFADDEFTFASNNSGNFEGTKSKKYYSMGIQLKASPDIRYGLMVATDSLARTAVNYKDNQFYVLNTSGTKVKGSNSAKKDADGNYWLISKSTDKLIGVYTVQTRVYQGATFQFKGDLKQANGTIKSNTWIDNGHADNTGKIATNIKKGLEKADGSDANYAVDLEKSMDYALNFYWPGFAGTYGR